MWWLKLYILICVTWVDIVNWDDDMIWIDELDMNIDYCGCDVNCYWEMRWGMRYGIVDIERMNWAIENVNLRLWWFGLDCWVMWIACVWW